METADVAIVFLGGLAGASIFGFVRPDREDNIRALFSMVCGTVISLMTTPAVCHFCNVKGILEYEVCVAFFIGLFGMTLCKALVVSAQTEAKGFWPWLLKVGKKIFGITE